MRFDKYNTINRSCSGAGVGEGVRERKEEGRQRRQWEERQESEEYQYGLIGMPAT